MKYSSNRKLVFIASVFLVCAIPVVSVFASPTISSVYQGTSKSYVLFKDGTVYSFDMNSESVKKSDVLSSVNQIAVGEKKAAVLKNDGSVWAWNMDDDSLKVIEGLSDIKCISAGFAHIIALKQDGTVWAWGENFEGQLGNNSTEPADLPVKINDLTNIKYIAAGFNHSIAIDQNGYVYTWGSNYFGQLGDSKHGGNIFAYDEGIDREVPYRVDGIENVDKAAGGWQHTIVLKSDGSVWGWGHNMNGQLGNGQVDIASGIVRANDLSGIIDIYAGGLYSLALKNDKTMYKLGTEPEVIEISNDNAKLNPYIFMTDVEYVNSFMDNFMVIKNDYSVWQNSNKTKIKADMISEDTQDLSAINVEEREEVLASDDIESVTSGALVNENVYISIKDAAINAIRRIFPGFY